VKEREGERRREEKREERETIINKNDTFSSYE
jgi:hypothetical protein